jgi:hypothetical protein
MTFWGLYTWSTDIVAPATIAKGATINATEKKSTADLVMKQYEILPTTGDSRNWPDRGSALDSLEVNRPVYGFIAMVSYCVKQESHQ